MEDNVRDFMKGVGKELSEATSYAQMKRIMDGSGMEYLGSGSARIVYKLDDDHVVKVAKNQFGLHQNATETDFYIQQEFEDFLTKTKDFDDENYRFTVAEYATKLKSDKDLFTKLEEFHGIEKDDFKDFVNGIHKSIMYNDKQGYATVDRVLEKYEDNELLQDMHRLCLETDILPGDFERHSSWGIVNNDGEQKLAIKDYGLTKENFNMYVAKSKHSPKPSGPRGPYM
jgi:hypothetical protein